MANISIRRKAEAVNKLFDVHIIIDGVDYTSLKDGQNKTVKLPPGDHEIQAKMSMFGSKKQRFTIKDGGDFNFTVKSYKKADFATLSLGCVTPLYLAFLVPNNKVLLGISVVLLGYIMYMFLFGRHKYLEIENSTL